MYDVVIIGAGASGCFTAIQLKEKMPSLNILIVEKTKQPLAKVKISGGGRCNVTHNSFAIDFLIEKYPRGSKFLRPLFHQFQPKDMISWLAGHGILLKAEKDGRMFPVSDSSSTIIELFLTLLQKYGVSIALGNELCDLEIRPEKFELFLKQGDPICCRYVVFATGGQGKVEKILEKLGHSLVPFIPSLFAFQIRQSWVKDLSGLSVQNATIALQGTKFSFTGPVLLTHFGMSGPAVLKLSAFAARWLFSVGYKTNVLINWTGNEKKEDVWKLLEKEKSCFPHKKLGHASFFGLPKNLWKALIGCVDPSLYDKNFGNLSKKDMDVLTSTLCQTVLTLEGKTPYKEEFVSAGGIDLKEIFPKSLESRKTARVFFAGELLDVDGITGGFNFQNAWTTGFTAAKAITEQLS